MTRFARFLPLDWFDVMFLPSVANFQDNFTVGLSNNSPSTKSPIVYGYSVCGQWPGAAPAGAAMFVQCADSLLPARYVIILGHRPNASLQICELEVYGKGELCRISTMSDLSMHMTQRPNEV